MDLLAAPPPSLEWGVLAAAFLYGVRHGFDLDHLAAITDITGAQTEKRKALELASLYALGHALVLLVLGGLAIAAGAYIPPSVDELMGRVIGASLVVLGLYVFYSVARYGSNAILRSRWALLASVGATLLHPARWVRARAAAREIVVEHAHEHDHRGPHEHSHDDDEAHHDHGHVPSVAPTAESGVAPAVAIRTRTHRHVHQHRALMPRDPFAFGPRAALGIGVIHGLGAETPTQVLLFATAAGVESTRVGLAVLFVFVAGLVVANSAIAIASAFGFLSRSRHPRLYLGLALATGAFSIVLGAGYLAGGGGLGLG